MKTLTSRWLMSIVLIFTSYFSLFAETKTDPYADSQDQDFLNFLKVHGYRSIPLEKNDYRLLIKGGVDGKSLTWLIDSGNTAFTTVMRSFVRKAKISLNPNDGMRIVGIGADERGTPVFRSSKQVEISLGDYPVGKSFIYAADLSRGLSDEGIQGIFGAELIKSKKIVVDFRNNNLYAWDMLAPQDSHDQTTLSDVLKAKGYTPIIMVFLNNSWKVDATINNQRSQFTVDTGAPGDLLLYRKAAKRLNLSLKETGLKTGGVGKNSQVDVDVTKFDNILLQGHAIHMDEVPVAEGGKNSTDGLLGLRFLQREKALVDFRNSTIYIKFDD